MSIGFESMEEVKDAVQEVPEIAEQSTVGAVPPWLESDDETDEIPPELEWTGEPGWMPTVKHRDARQKAENAIKDGNKITIEHRKADLAKIEAKEMMKK